MSAKSSRISREAMTVQVMITLYCRHHHNKSGGLCSECTNLRNYALERLRKCPFQEGKTTCAKCPVHCYSSEMREKIREVMRYSGPRMTYRHPVLALFHFIDRMRKKPIPDIDNAVK